jgi:exopolysaccharide production protein ExoQ
MSDRLRYSIELDRARSSASTIDGCAIAVMSACIFSLIVSPLLIYLDSSAAQTLQSMLAPRLENRIFWPVLIAISTVLAIQNRSRLAKLSLPPHIVCLFAYLAFAGASVLWAFRPELSFIRFVQQVMIVSSIVLSAMMAARNTDLMRGLFLCFALASILNLFFVLFGSPEFATYGSMGKVNIGYPGYFAGKNYLGECGAITVLLSLHESLHRGFRRFFSITILIIATLLIFWSNSKTALGLAVIAPVLAGFTLLIRRIMRFSPAIILISIPILYVAVSSISGFNLNRLSYMIYGDSTFTGRTIIWDFAQQEIALRPFLGWGYQSFWLVGPDAPSIVDARGWVKGMPNAHSGFYDTMIEMGYVGLGLLIAFILTTLHGIGRIADQDRARAWLLLSLALYIILWNFLESLWMRGFEFLWVVFLIITAEVARYWQPSPSPKSLDGTMPRSGNYGPSRAMQVRGKYRSSRPLKFVSARRDNN